MGMTLTVRREESAGAAGKTACPPMIDGDLEKRRILSAKAEVANAIMAAHTSLGRGQYWDAKREALDAAHKAKKHGFTDRMKTAAQIYLTAAVLTGDEYLAKNTAADYGLTAEEAAEIVKSALTTRLDKVMVNETRTATSTDAANALIAVHVLFLKAEEEAEAGKLINAGLKYEALQGKALAAAEKARVCGMTNWMREAAEIYLRSAVMVMQGIMASPRVEMYGIRRDEAARIERDAERIRDGRPKQTIYHF